MAIKYEIHDIENVAGTGKKRSYVQLKTAKAKTVDELADILAHSCSITKSDVLAVMTELCHVAVDELSGGNRFYIPEIGYLSLSAGNIPVDKLPKGKISGKDIFLRNLNFHPEKKFIRMIQDKVRFEKSKYSSVSANYSKETLWQQIEAYLTENRHITRRQMCEHFGLTDYKAKQWLEKFVADGRIVKDTFGKQQIYSLA